MFSAPPLLPISLTLCSLAAALALVSVDTRPPELRPDALQWRRAIERASSEYLPAHAMACGLVDLGGDAAATVRCVQDARRRGLAFWALSQGRGEDSQVWALVVGEGDALRAVAFDSYGWEQRGRPSFTNYTVACKALDFGTRVLRANDEFHEQAVSCVRE